MTALAGYALEQILDVAPYFEPDVWDHARVLDLLRQFEPRRPKEGLKLLDGWRDQAYHLLLKPEILNEITAAADLLLEKGVVDGGTFYASLYRRSCSARHPEHFEWRCVKSPHPYGDHYSRADGADFVMWSGLPMPGRQRVGAMTALHRNIRAVNLGMPPRPRTKAWQDALDLYEPWA